MKIKCITSGYSGPCGSFTAGQVREVNEETGRYLLKSFPTWFEEVTEDSAPSDVSKARDMQPEHNTAMRAGSTRKAGRGRR